MNNTIRWIIAAVLALALALGLTCPSIVEAEGAQLPLDYTQGGKPPKAEGWTMDGKTPVGYKDSTIEVTTETGKVTYKVKGKKVAHPYWVVRIKIQDPTQLRTAVSKDTYQGRGGAQGVDIAKSKNAVAAMNGDFFKYEYDVGYVVRQGELIRDATDNKRGRLFDMLIIDDHGDFHSIPSADTAKVDAFVKETLEPQGRKIMQAFNLGPVLVLNGQAQDMAETEAARQGSYQWKYPQQRIALVQTGELEYAIVEVYGKTDSSAGLTMQEFADFVAEKCPDAIIAYNFDGGGSVNLIMKNTRICKTPGLREITDIIYFASAEE